MTENKGKALTELHKKLARLANELAKKHELKPSDLEMVFANLCIEIQESRQEKPYTGYIG